MGSTLLLCRADMCERPMSEVWEVDQFLTSTRLSSSSIGVQHNAIMEIQPQLKLICDMRVFVVARYEYMVQSQLVFYILC